MLFPVPGTYRIVVEASWTTLGVALYSVGETAVKVTAASDAAHADAARRVLASPEMLLALALGGDHLKEGIEAIGAALKNDVLRPHFAYVEARRRATRFHKRMPDLKAAADLIDETAVMSSAELRKAVRLVEANAGNIDAAALMAKLKSRISGSDAGDGIKTMARRL